MPQSAEVVSSPGRKRARVTLNGALSIEWQWVMVRSDSAEMCVCVCVCVCVSGGGRCIDLRADRWVGRFAEEGGGVSRVSIQQQTAGGLSEASASGRPTCDLNIAGLKVGAAAMMRARSTRTTHVLIGKRRRFFPRMLGCSFTAMGHGVSFLPSQTGACDVMKQQCIVGVVTLTRPDITVSCCSSDLSLVSLHV